MGTLTGGVWGGRGLCAKHGDPWGHTAGCSLLSAVTPALQLSCIWPSENKAIIHLLDTDSLPHWKLKNRKCGPFVYRVKYKTGHWKPTKKQMTINPHDQTKWAGIRFPYKESPGTGKIKWLEIVLVLPYGIQEGRVCRSKIFWSGKGHTKLAHMMFCTWNVTVFHSPCSQILLSHTTLILLTSLIEHKAPGLAPEMQTWTRYVLWPQETHSPPQSFPWPLTRCKFLKTRASWLIFPDCIFIYFTNILTI